MIPLVIVLAAVGPALLVALWIVREAFRDSRAEVARLYALLEAKAAPVEYATYVGDDAQTDLGTWLASEDGLIVYRLDDEDD